MNKKWECYEANEKQVEYIARKYSISKLLAMILVNRNIIEDEKVNVFLNPTRRDFYNPFLMPDMEKAVDRIINAIENNQKIMIFGDYDVDGITSTTVLKKFLLDRNVCVSEYIPNRLYEGYGLNKQAIKKIVDDKYNLIITVDCGISAIEEVEYANSLGIETIITDHHEPGETLPKALAVVDAKRKDSQYPFNSLAGVGVVFKLIDENRVITKLGLKLVEVTKNIGLKTLLNISGYKTIDSNTISFGIAPRINACGRMGHAKEALNLFFVENEEEANKIAQRLNEYNKERQEIEKRIFDEAVEQIEKENENKEVIVLGKENWHHGVIGIVSSKITELYFKPSVLICFEEEMRKRFRKKHTSDLIYMKH